jgi:hypothetical protein
MLDLLLRLISAAFPASEPIIIIVDGHRRR